MPRPSKGPRLRLRPARADRQAVWVIADTEHEEGTGCGALDRAGAEQYLAAYIGRKHVIVASVDERDPAEVPIADTLALYARDVARDHSRPKETAQRINALLDFFGDKMLVEINGTLCREYAARCATPAAARRNLEELRAAINYHRREGLCSKIVEVTLPAKGRQRERWLTRPEAARLIRAARARRRHIARFILVALYSGSRASVVCGAALQPTEGHGWIDLKRGVFYRKAPGAKVTKKRAPAIPLPSRLLAHLRRWKRLGQKFAVEHNGLPVKRVSKAFRRAARDAGLGDVTPHTLRHTAATWMMQAGTDMWEAAGYLGMTVEMLSERYGHHHPAHLTNARTAFERLRLVK